MTVMTILSFSDAYNEIVERNKYYLQLHRERRYDELYEFYTEDCRYMAQGKELIIGKTGYTDYTNHKA